MCPGYLLFWALTILLFFNYIEKGGQEIKLVVDLDLSDFAIYNFYPLLFDY